MFSKSVVFIWALALTFSARAYDPYDALMSLPDKLEHQPRLLNTVDVPDLRPHDPQELITPEGDFNRDGRRDMAIAGVYDLPGRSHSFFLLVADIKGMTPIQLFYREFDHPILLHEAGTTGPGDLKTQAFSFTTCWECERGTDAVWNPKTKTFDLQPWEARVAKPAPVPSAVPEVPDTYIDQALKTAGLLPDVLTFVSDVKQRGGKLGTRAEWKSIDRHQFWLSIFEKTDKGEQSYDRILFDGEKKKILQRDRTVKGAK